MKETKKKAIKHLKTLLELKGMALRLYEIDPRLNDYYHDLANHSEGEDDRHNLYELLGAMKLLRLMRTYEVDISKVQQVIRLREGEWHKEGDMWVYDSGGLLLPGTRGLTHYRWEPFQIFVLTAMYGVRGWIDTEVMAGSRQLLPSERVNVENNHIEDLRRLCTDFTFFAPRKTDKTGLSAYNNFLFFMLEDADSEIYCTANSQTQSKVLYDRTQKLIRQMDPQGKRIRFTATTTNWKPLQARSSQLWALSAGGKTKDGLFAQLCCADEFGSAGYVKGKSDMGALVNVVLSSMGPRREPMLFTSTTAGNIEHGPFVDKLAGIKRELLKEINYAEKTDTPTIEGDRWMCIILEPDEWEMDEDILLSSKSVRRKVNPMLGTIVQHSFYDQAVADSRLDPLKKQETITKLFNVYRSATSEEWIKPEQIRRLQVPMRVDDCKYEDGWSVYAGMDFSQGCDLHAVSYLCWNWKTYEFFADMDAWVTEETMETVSISELYRQWVKGGWLHVSPGAVLQAALPVNRIMELDKKGVDFIAFGYDSYQSKEPILLLKEWLFGMGITDPNELVIPVSQTFASYNPAVIKAENCIKSDPPLIHFSENPMWPWEFGCCMLEIDPRMENRKPLKRNPGSDACKVDNVQCLCTGFILEEMFEGKITK